MEIPFVHIRKKRWTRLHELLQKAEAAKLSSFNKEDLVEFCVLYRQVATDLSLAKSQHLPHDIITFLNDLVARAYNHIYHTEKSTLRQIKHLILYEIPSLFRQHWPVILFSFLLLLSGWSLGFFGYLNGPTVMGKLLPPEYLSILKKYETNTWFNDPLVARPYISVWIMRNNILVALTAFAGGMLLGTLTCYIIFLNGFLLGALSGLFFRKGYFLSFWAMILPHGVIELTAIVLSATAGFLLTRVILFPGEYSRQDAFRLYGTQTVKFLMGTVVLLILAAIIEGFFSTTSTKIIPESFRLIFAGFTAIFLYWYFSRPLPQK